MAINNYSIIIVLVTKPSFVTILTKYKAPFKPSTEKSLFFSKPFSNLFTNFPVVS